MIFNLKIKGCSCLFFLFFLTCFVAVFPQDGNLSSVNQLFMKLKHFDKGHGKKLHTFSITGVDFSPSMQHSLLSVLLVFYCQIWLEPLFLLPNLNEHLVLLHLKNLCDNRHVKHQVCRLLGTKVVLTCHVKFQFQERKKTKAGMTFGMMGSQLVVICH